MYEFLEDSIYNIFSFTVNCEIQTLTVIVKQLTIFNNELTVFLIELTINKQELMMNDFVNSNRSSVIY